MALYDFTAETEGDLPFQQGDRILVTDHIDDEWWSGRMNGREGFFPKAFVEVVTGKWTGAGNILSDCFVFFRSSFYSLHNYWLFVIFCHFSVCAGGRKW